MIFSWLRVTELSFPALAFCCRGTVVYLCTWPYLRRAHRFSSFPSHQPFPSNQCSWIAFLPPKCRVVSSGACKAENVSENLSRLGRARWGWRLFEENLEVSEADRRDTSESRGGAKQPAVRSAQSMHRQDYVVTHAVTHFLYIYTNSLSHTEALALQ